MYLSRPAPKIENPKSTAVYEEKNYHIYFFIISAMIGWGVMFYSGVYSLLWFMPDHYGFFDRAIEDWITLRDSWALICGIFLSLFTYNALSENAEQKRHIIALERELEKLGIKNYIIRKT